MTTDFIPNAEMLLTGSFPFKFRYLVTQSTAFLVISYRLAKLHYQKKKKLCHIQF